MKRPTGLIAALALGVVCGLYARRDVSLQSHNEPDSRLINSSRSPSVKRDISAKLAEARFLDPGTERIEQALRHPTSLSFQNVTLTDMVSLLEKQIGVPCSIDRVTIEDEGISWKDIRISAVAKDVPLRDTFRNILAPHQLMALNNDDEIIVMPAIGCSRPFTKIYPAADLVTVPFPGGIELRHATLIDLITSMIEPETWDVVGGDSSIQFDPATISFLIHQHATQHQTIEQLFVRLRQMRNLAPILVRDVDGSIQFRQTSETFAHHRHVLAFIERDLQELELVEARNQPLGFSGLGGGGFFNVSGNDPVEPSPNEYARPTWYEIAARARRLSLRAMLVALEVAEAK